MIHNRIKKNFDGLTPAQKKAAHYIRNNIVESSSLTAKEIGERCGCSEPTIHRLAKVLGYANYLEMSKSIKEVAFEKRVMRRFNNLVTSNDSRQESWLNEHFAGEVDNLNETMMLLNKAKIAEAVNMILNSKRIYFAGWRAGLGVTSYMSYVLNYLLGNSKLIPQGEAAEYSNYFTEHDLLIVAGFPRYCKTTLKVCEKVKEKNSKILCLTDSEISPFYVIADLAFIAKTKTKGMIDSYVAPLSIAHLIINEVAYQKPEFVRTNINSMEQSLKSFDLEYNWK
ncbi:MurR/RpiR family transcriptional regulator [Clostridium sp. 'deep sea']|uniref:MurR/RpiR family transcriptional regulator n=1 Tax=Clostridium sp. 'deep sea' TaxID=2779445 RepID=UPI0018968508|nr:MurR/RpiR family transcriptional regulator [Clostridium sp. 'deep sea']QOR35489.1 MurR/RpiR family transcriptional regulator [Clostridium sp. 'deep sea']